MFQTLKKESLLLTLKLSLPLIALSVITARGGIQALMDLAFFKAFLGLGPGLFGLYRILYALFGGYQRRVRRYLRGAPNPALAQSQMEQAFAAAQRSARLCVAGPWTFLQRGPATYLYETQEILWVYELNRTVRHGLILHLTHHFLIVGLCSGKRIQFRMPKAQTELAMEMFRVSAPFVVRGYLHSLDTLFKKDLAQFIHLARSQQLQKDVILDESE